MQPAAGRQIGGFEPSEAWRTSNACLVVGPTRPMVGTSADVRSIVASRATSGGKSASDDADHCADYSSRRAWSRMARASSALCLISFRRACRIVHPRCGVGSWDQDRSRSIAARRLSFR